MKIPKILSLILALSLIGVVAAGCSKKAATTTTTTTEVTVGTGNVTVSITSTGSMDYSDYENLSFATDGTVGAVNVKVGDLVTKGQVLATLDSDAWNTYLDSLTQAVQTAQSNLTTAQSTIASRPETGCHQTTGSAVSTTWRDSSTTWRTDRAEQSKQYNRRKNRPGCCRCCSGKYRCRPSKSTR